MPEESTDTKPVPAGPRYQKLRPGVRGRNGLSRDQVEEHQRTRLYAAMVEIAGTHGYRATTIKAVCAVAGVSRQTFYDLFGNDKQACFLGAYDYVVRRAAERIKLAYSGERDRERRLSRAFEQFAREAASEPQAARFALLEPFSAGPAAVARMDHGRETFEGLIGASIGNASPGTRLSPTIARGVVGGVEQVARMYLLAGKIDQLTAKAGDLSAWMSCYRPWSHTSPVRGAGAVTRRHAGLRCKDERLRILRAAAAIAARDGYERLSRARIARLAEVSEETFTSLYPGIDAIEACFLASLDLLGVEALACAARASQDVRAWPEAIRSGITALMEHIATDPCLGRVAFIEIFSAGPSAIERRSKLLERLRDEITHRVPDSQRPPELVGQAIVGAIWAIVHDYVVRGQARRLRELADDATYLALAPVIGHETAVQVVNRVPREL